MTKFRTSSLLCDAVLRLPCLVSEVPHPVEGPEVETSTLWRGVGGLEPHGTLTQTRHEDRDLQSGVNAWICPTPRRP